MELQLMHRWSTVTYNNILSKFAENHKIWQTTVPEVALKHDFLLNGLFATSAFEIASSCEHGSARYASAALEYQDLAFRGFQAQLCNITHESHEEAIYFSILLMVLALASAQYGTARGELNHMVQEAVGHFEILRGIAVVLAKNPHSVTACPLVHKVKPLK
jgi:Fungal specific transcription factor domain